MGAFERDVIDQGDEAALWDPESKSMLFEQWSTGRKMDQWRDSWVWKMGP